MAIAQKTKGYRKSGSLFIYIRKKRSYRYNKKNGRQNRVSLDELPVQLEITEEESPYDKISYKEMEATIGKDYWRIAGKMPFDISYGSSGQLKPKEIAERLLHSENTVRVQTKIAIEKIIKQIKPYYPDLTLSLLWSFFFSSIS